MIFRFHPKNIQHLGFRSILFASPRSCLDLPETIVRVASVGGGPLKPLPNGGHINLCSSPKDSTSCCFFLSGMVKGSLLHVLSRERGFWRSTF